MRNKQLAEPLSILELFFELFRCRDKSLRKFLYAYIVSDIKNVNSKRKDPKLNKVCSGLVAGALEALSTPYKVYTP